MGLLSIILYSRGCAGEIEGENYESRSEEKKNYNL